MSEATRLRFVCVAWGREYLRSLIDNHLPSVLTPGNLPAVAASRRCAFSLYVTRDQAEWLEAHASIQTLRRTMPLEVIAIEDVTDRPRKFGWRYRVMNDCHADAISLLEPDEAISFLAPDMIWGEGSLLHVSRLLDAGKRVVVAAGVRLNRDEFLEVRSRLPWILSNRELVRLAMRHLHPTIRASFWAGPNQNIIPSNLLWRQPRGLLVHGYQLHPMLVWPTNPNALPPDAVDGEWLELCTPGLPDDAYHVIGDSDDHACFELTPEPARSEFILPVMQTVSRLVKWAEQSTVRRHRWFSLHPIRLHHGDVTQEWERVERKAMSVMREVVSLVDGTPEDDSSRAQAMSLLRLAERMP